MSSHYNKDRYKAILRIEGKTILKLTGDNIEDLKVRLIGLCESEHSGAEGEIIEVATGNSVYRCHKQTIIDQ